MDVGVWGYISQIYLSFIFVLEDIGYIRKRKLISCSNFPYGHKLQMYLIFSSSLNLIQILQSFVFVSSVSPW